MRAHIQSTAFAAAFGLLAGGGVCVAQNNAEAFEALQDEVVQLRAQHQTLQRSLSDNSLPDRQSPAKNIVAARPDGLFAD